MKDLKRIQLFEFEDLSWFPDWLRTCLTNLIVVLNKLLGVGEVLASLIAEILKERKLGQIVDLGSGSGGAMPEVLRLLRKKEGLSEVALVMTDKYPNQRLVAHINQGASKGIRYNEQSVDATDIAQSPEGLKTMVNSFHHMPPTTARKILESAEEAKQAILIYEMAENKIPLLVWWLLLPISLVVLMIMTLLMTPFVKPLTWEQLVFTYIVPIIPICYAWDGQASLPRMYSFKDIDTLLEGLGNDGYQWKKGRAQKANGKNLGTYIMGFPKG